MEKIELESIALSSYIDYEKLKEFDCSVQMVNDFINNKALENQDIVSTTIFTDKNNNGKIVAYYTTLANVTKFSDPVTKEKNEFPTIRLAFFGVDKQYQGKRIGRNVMKYLFRDLLIVRQTMGFTHLTVEALTQVFDFYVHCGFKEIVPGNYDNYGHTLKTQNLYIPANDMFERLP